jgi:hypothetical protein
MDLCNMSVLFSKEELRTGNLRAFCIFIVNTTPHFVLKLYVSMVYC